MKKYIAAALLTFAVAAPAYAQTAPVETKTYIGEGNAPWLYKSDDDADQYLPCSKPDFTGGAVFKAALTTGYFMVVLFPGYVTADTAMNTLNGVARVDGVLKPIVAQHPVQYCISGLPPTYAKLNPADISFIRRHN